MTIEVNDFNIIGMHCAACVSRIEKVISNIDGVIEMRVNLATEKGQVTFDKKFTNIDIIFKKIANIGFEAQHIHPNTLPNTDTKKQDLNVLKWKVIFSAILTLPLAWAMLVHLEWAASIYTPTLFQHAYFQLTLTFPIQFLIGFTFYDNAWKAVKNGSANMDVLVVLSTSAAFFYSHYLTFSTSPLSTESVVLYYETSAFIITFILLGRFLEAKTKLKTTTAIEQLYELQTKTAIKYEKGIESELPIEAIQPGHVIVIQPGDSVPIDGQVIDGSSLINEALLTGESIPIVKDYGNFVYAGTVNQSGILHIKVTKRASETMLANIIRTVENAQISKAPIQHIADRVTGIFVPIVILIALTTFAGWYLFLLPGHLNSALESMIAVLIIACPCALGLATPTSVMVGSGRASQLGILFKEGKYLELLNKCTMVVFDKTGTLTKGVPQVTNIYTDEISEQELRMIVGAVEQHSTHPIAKAITSYATKETSQLPIATNVMEIPGYGVKATVHGRNVTIANPAYFTNNNLSIPSHYQKVMEELVREIKTVMFVKINSTFCGIIAITDEIKPSSSTTVSQLKQMGLDIGILTGDNHAVGTAVARKLGIKKLHTEVSPVDKATIIEHLQQDGHRVIMVGDGINDAPALTIANVGVALGTGSNVAMESGDVTIIKGDLDRVIDAIYISKLTLRNIKQNLLWAFLYNIIMIPFAMLGLLAPWLAGAAMALSSVSVVLNSLRLKTIKIRD